MNECEELSIPINEELILINDEEKEIENKLCRICLESDSIEQLISPCLCSGTSQYVHHECLSRWRTTTTNEDAIYMCMECRFHYEIKKNNCTKICDRILVYSTYKYTLICRRIIDYLIYIQLLDYYKLYGNDNKLFSGNQFLLFYIECINLVIMTLIYNIIICMMNTYSYKTSSQLLRKFKEYKSVIRLGLFISIAFISIQPEISACIISCIIDQWYWFFIVSIYNFNSKFRKIVDLKK